jgi:transcriptional regulator with XRE-family HTH domain
MFDPVVIGPRQGRRRTRPLLRTMLGDVLRRTRLAQGRTLADVARAARVSMAYLSEIERGRKEASSEVLAAICDALRIELADLLAATGRDLAKDAPGRVIRLGAPGAADPPASADLTGGADLAGSADLADVADLAGSADLTGGADLAGSADLADGGQSGILRGPQRSGDVVCRLAA